MRSVDLLVTAAVVDLCECALRWGVTGREKDTEDRLIGNAQCILHAYKGQASSISHLDKWTACQSLKHNRIGQQLVAIRILINNPSFDTDRYSPMAPAPWWHVRKTPPPTKLQIPAIVTTLCQSKLNKQKHQMIHTLTSAPLCKPVVSMTTSSASSCMKSSMRYSN